MKELPSHIESGYIRYYYYNACLENLLHLYSTNRALREYLKHDAVEFLQNLRHVLQEVPVERRSTFQRILAASVRHRSYSSRERPAVKLRKAIPFMTEEDGTLLPGVLEYITEGIVPLIYTYYTSLFQSTDPTSPIEQDKEEIATADPIASALIVSVLIRSTLMIKTALSLFHFACQQELVHCNVVDFMSSKVQFEQFRETVLTLFKFKSILQRLKIDVEVLVECN